jgi:hypothetical protein
MDETVSNGNARPLTGMLSTEERLLAWCGKATFTPADKERCLAELRSPVSVDRFLALSRRHKVLPSVVTHLSDLADEAPGPVVRGVVDALTGDYERRREYIAQVIQPELESIAKAFSAAGVTYAFTKGAHLLAEYPDVRMRQLNDVDVLVHDVTDLFRAYDVLHELGYCLWFRYENPWLEAGTAGGAESADVAGMAGHIVFTRFLTADTQTGPADLNRVQVEIYTSGQTVGIEHLESGIWDRLRTEGRGFRVPGPEDALLILLAHNVKHGEYFLKDLNDVYLLATRYRDELDWDYVVRTARRNGLDAMGALLLRLLNEIYDAPVIPDAVLAELGNSRLGDAVARASFTMRNHAQLSSTVLQAPVVWAQRSAERPLRRVGTVAKAVASFAVALPLEYQDNRLARPAERLWRRLDNPARWLGGSANRMNLIPIACLPDDRLDLERVLESGAIPAGYLHRTVLPGRLIQVHGGTCHVVLHADYIFIPTDIPYKPSRAILGARVQDHIAFAHHLLAQFRRSGCTTARVTPLTWFPSQEPFVAM